MILRRVIEHVRKQEWTAIFIDFVIVVVGVFVGIQVSNWNAARVDQGRAHGYIERIGADLDADLASFAERLAFWKAVGGYGAAALDYVDAGDAGERSQWQLLLAFFQASQVSEFYTTMTTYDELTGAGDGGLLPSIALRDALARYYALSENAAFTERPQYREHVRGKIPFPVQAYIWDHCYKTDAIGQQTLFDCASPISDEEAARLVAAIVSDARLIEEMRYWVSALYVGEKIIAAHMDSAKALRAMLEDTKTGRR